MLSERKNFMPKKPKSTSKYDSTREQNVLLEKISSDVKTVAEGHSVLNRKIDQVNAKLVEHDKCFDRIEMVVMENSRDIKVLKADVNTLKADVKEVKAGQDDIRHLTKDYEERLKKLEVA